MTTDPTEPQTCLESDPDRVAPERDYRSEGRVQRYPADTNWRSRGSGSVCGAVPHFTHPYPLAKTRTLDNRRDSPRGLRNCVELE